jgi:hypothetical protein
MSVCELFVRICSVGVSTVYGATVALEGVAMFVYLVSRSADHTGETRGNPGMVRAGWFSRLIALFSARR